MYCENDVADNNAHVRNDKPKPYFQLIANELILSGIPVPKNRQWTRSQQVSIDSYQWKEAVKKFLFRSQFIHYIHFKYWLFCHREELANNCMPAGKDPTAYLALTSRILEELKKDVKKSGANFVVCFIPSKLEVEKLATSLPYQVETTQLCWQLDIECFDLAPAFKHVWPRTYYRQGMHWNARGHKVAANALYDFIIKNVTP